MFRNRSLTPALLLVTLVVAPVGSAQTTPADAVGRFRSYVDWLADDARQGRGLGTAGLDQTSNWLAERMHEIGLEPGNEGSFLQPFDFITGVQVGDGSRLEIAGTVLAAEAWTPTSFSAATEISGLTAAAGYGIVSPELGVDDYSAVDVSGKIAVVHRFVPETEAFSDPEVERRYSDLHYKAFVAREHGAIGLLVVDPEAELPSLGGAGGSDAGIPVAVARGETAARLLETPATIHLRVDLDTETTESSNVVGRLTAGAGNRLPGVLVVGAHYDHLGYGGSNSRDAATHVIHNGADDNASGTAALLLVARQLAAQQYDLRRDIYFVAFTGEESGILGSSHFTRKPPPGLEMTDVVAMLNMDMVGRLRDDKVDILGGRSANEWLDVLEPLCAAAALDCSAGGSGYGPSDHTPFYIAGAPVLHFFTGTHDDYHTSTDDSDKINADGGARVAGLVAATAAAIADREEGLTYEKVADPAPKGDLRSEGASLGTIPNYDPSDETPGVLLSDVRPEGPADNAGLQGGDRIVGLSGSEIRTIQDLMLVLGAANPGDRTTLTILRDGERLEREVVLGKPRRRR